MTLVIADFELQELIATGSRSKVYRACDRRSDEVVAVKILPQSCVETAWQRELAALSMIHHQNVIQLLESGPCEDGAYLALEWLPSTDLATLVSQETLTTLSAFHQLAEETLSALCATHQAGFLHRDVKPENLMQTQSGTWKLIDFGEARTLKEAGQQSMTGSVYFMAPEQFGHAPLTPRTDLYSLGCTLYFALTGNYLHDGETTPQVIASHLHPRLVDLSEHCRFLPPEMAQWLQTLVSRQTSARPMTAALALQQFQSLKIDSRS
jgi:eukaryotic-like serine/threonine-protein kinase